MDAENGLAPERMRPREWLVPRGANPEGVGLLKQWLVHLSMVSLPMRRRWLVLVALRYNDGTPTAFIWDVPLGYVVWYVWTQEERNRLHGSCVTAHSR